MLYLSDFKNNNKIRGIQRGIVSFSSGQYYSNVSITPVNLQKTELRSLGFTGLNYTGDFRMYFLDSSTIQLHKADTGSSYASWELTEWE